MTTDRQGSAPELFAVWMGTHIANDMKFGRKGYRYHPRSDEHSKMLCSLVLADLQESCPLLAQHMKSGKVVAGINSAYTFKNGKKKNLDLAIGTPISSASSAASKGGKVTAMDRLLVACEAKQCMTEHIKTKPRIYDELSSAHEIVHQGDTLIVSLGVVVVNIASRYASPTRQTKGKGPLDFTPHRQPEVTQSMVEHLRGLQMREKPGEIGFDAFATIIVDCDNVGSCRLHAAPPAPQPGEKDHYGTFLKRFSAAYSARFSAL